VDTFELFKVYFDNKLGDLKSELVQEQDSLTKKLNEDVSLKFKHEGNKIQHKFNEEIVSELNKLLKVVPLSESHVIQLISNLVEKEKGRNKLIRIADTSTGDWTTVREYESNIIASDSEDEKKIRQADARAVRIIKDKSRNRAHPYKASAKPIAMETAPNPYYSSNYKRQDRPPFRAGNGVSRPRGTCVMPADRRDTGDENAHYSRCINRSTAPVPARNSEKINDKAVND
jgi:hypothetical protein